MIAYLFCLCLAIVGVFGQLTDGDLAKVGAIVTSLLGAFEIKINAKFDTLETKFDTLETTVGNQIGDMKTFFTKAFSDSHFSTAIAL